MKRSRMRLAATGVAMLVPLVTLAGTSVAARPGSTQGRTPLAGLAYTQGYKDTIYNRFGHVIATYSKDGIALTKTVLGPLGGAVTAGSLHPAPVADPVFTTLKAPAAGCMVHDQFITAKLASWAGSVLAFKYHVTGYWCWDNAFHLGTVTLGASFTDVGQSTHVDTATADVDSELYPSAIGTGYWGYAEGSARVGILGQQLTASPEIQIWMSAGPWCTGTANA